MSDPRSLFSAYAAGGISAGELQTLEAALRDDPDLRREFAEYMNIDSALGDLAALSEAEVSEIEQTSRPPVLRPARFRRIAALAGAVAAGLIIAASLWFSDPPPVTEAAMATRVADIHAVLLREGRPWEGTALPAGEYRLDRGLVNLRFDGGVMVYVEAPARFDVASAKRLRLHGGRLSATVPPEGVGFAVDTPEAEVVDFGTEFCIDVEAGASEVHVFEGHVRVQPKSGRAEAAVDLRTAQAVKIADVARKPVEIKLATDRFIRNFDEPQQGYHRMIRRLVPLAAYRMAIRNKGLVSDPPGHPGVILTGDGTRPPNARGAIGGGSMRVGFNSIGRGGRVDAPPPLQTGRFTFAVFAYLQAPGRKGTLATNLRGDRGNFAISVDGNGLVRATLRSAAGKRTEVSGASPLSLKTWRHLVMTADGEQLRLYENGKEVAATFAPPLAESGVDPLWFGTDADGISVWQGRLDEPVLFDRPLDATEIAALYRAAARELDESK